MTKTYEPVLSTKFEELWHLVGNTPMVKLEYIYKNQPGSIYLKCEHYNLTGSIKDRDGPLHFTTGLSEWEN